MLSLDQEIRLRVLEAMPTVEEDGVPVDMDEYVRHAQILEYYVKYGSLPPDHMD